jgi:hypothetical protein
LSEALAKIQSTRQYRETLSVPARNELTRITNGIREETYRLRTGIIQLAGYLLEAKEIVGYGNWGAYVEAECPEISLDTADRLVLVAQLVKKQELTAEQASRLSKCTLYSLVSASTPLAVKRDVIRSARQGVVIPPKQVRAMIREYDETLTRDWIRGTKDLVSGVIVGEKRVLQSAVQGLEIVKETLCCSVSFLPYVELVEELQEKLREELECAGEQAR